MEQKHNYRLYKISQKELQTCLSTRFPNYSDSSYIEGYLNRVEVFLENKDYAQALACYRDILPKIEEIAPPKLMKNFLNNKGHILNELGNYQESIQCFEKIRRDFDLEDEDNDIDCNVLCELGSAYQCCAKFQEALNCYKEAKKFNCPIYKEFLSHRLEELKEYDADWLSQQLAKVTVRGRRTTDEEKAYQLLLNAYQSGGEGKHRKALKQYKEALALVPENAEILNNMAYEYNQLQEPHLAAECANRAIKYDSKFANPWRHLGNAHFSLGHYKEAMQYYNRALQLNPHYLEAKTDKKACQRSLNEIELIQLIQSKVTEYKESLTTKVNKTTFFGVTFGYNKTLNEDKKHQAERLIKELSSISTMTGAIKLLEHYLEYDKALALQYQIKVDSFSALLQEVLENMDKYMNLIENKNINRMDYNFV